MDADQRETNRRSWFLAWILLPVFCLGCTADKVTSSTAPPLPRASIALAPDVSAPRSAGTPTVQLTAYDASKNGAEANGAGNDADKSTPAEKITLPLAVQMCVAQNFRLRAGAEKLRQAEADLLTASLIPNPALMADYILIPLQRTNIDNQLGPPQVDVDLTIPIDWLVFGKRVAAMQAARLGIEVSNADYADLYRQQVGRTVDAFYEVLMDAAYLKHADENLEELEQIEKYTEERVKAKKSGKLEQDRARLAVHEALLDRHDRELALEVAKARLRPLLGRTAADPLYEVEGSLAVSAVVPPLKLAEAVALAEMHRPDLIGAQYEVAQAHANVELERRKAKPQVSVTPGWTYQIQHNINGFRDGSMFDIGIISTLPFTDRNQGNILKAQAREVESYHNYLADRADALAEVETAVAEYDDAIEHLTQFNTKETLEAAHDLHKNMEAAYRAGTRTLDELLLAHRAYRDRLGHVVEFESTYWRALNKLNMMVGLQRSNEPDPQARHFSPTRERGD